MRFSFAFILVVGWIATVSGCATARQPSPPSPPSPSSPATQRDASTPAKALPVVYAHGFFGFGTLPLVGDYVPGLHAALAEQDQELFFADVPNFTSPQQRAPALARRIREVIAQTGAPQVHLVAHSMGGLDARIALQDHAVADLVFSLTTISSPHHGFDFPAVTHWIPEPVYTVFLGPVTFLVDVARGQPLHPLSVHAALWELDRSQMEAFNARYPVPQGVHVFSIAGVTSTVDEMCRAPFGSPAYEDTPAMWLFPSFLVMRGVDQTPVANDGIVPVWSARFGEFLGCVPADHGDVINQGVELFTAFNRNNLDVLSFYQTLGKRLRALEKTGSRQALLAPLVEVNRRSSRRRHFRRYGTTGNHSRFGPDPDAPWSD